MRFEKRFSVWLLLLLTSCAVSGQETDFELQSQPEVSLEFLLFLASLEPADEQSTELWVDPLDMLMLDPEISAELASADKSSISKEQEQ